MIISENKMKHPNSNIKFGLAFLFIKNWRDKKIPIKDNVLENIKANIFRSIDVIFEVSASFKDMFDVVIFRTRFKYVEIKNNAEIIVKRGGIIQYVEDI